MIHGCQKKIYHIKNVSGKYFDEAYLVMRDSALEECVPAKDLADEAERIIREATAAGGFRRRHRGGGLKNAMIFALGAATSSAIIGAVAMIFLR